MIIVAAVAFIPSSVADHHSSLLFSYYGTTTGRKVGHKDRSLSRKRRWQRQRQQQQQLGSGKEEDGGAG